MLLRQIERLSDIRAYCRRVLRSGSAPKAPLAYSGVIKFHRAVLFWRHRFLFRHIVRSGGVVDLAERENPMQT